MKQGCYSQKFPYGIIRCGVFEGIYWNSFWHYISEEKSQDIEIGDLQVNIKCGGKYCTYVKTDMLVVIECPFE